MTAKDAVAIIHGIFFMTVTMKYDHKVEMPAGPATGREIRGPPSSVSIQLNFVLQVQLPNGSSKGSATTTRAIRPRLHRHRCG